ncbi:Metal ion transporter [Rhodotorula toruloides ATCC 204091]|uniref:Metal ion transporter n=1 Tax=Rhodotorula toruloides TaxID=5286 RepID=A0A0K3CPF0_RHOTO|nr:Metal ion transporter [Rhodotorula toruloides ATCC 204091]KAK4330286.1 Low-affinity Fe(2+) transport protein [Rhodotorula toruloides]PRQ70915.1 metal ion transporter [Rhodotorula toruloides]
MFRRLITVLASPGSRPALVVSAPSVLPAGAIGADKAVPRDDSSLDLLKSEEKLASWQDNLATSPADSSVKVVDGIVAPRSRLDRYLDTIVHWSGSLPFFLFVSSGLIAWAILGVAGYGHDTNWNVLISDIQAVLTYILDSFLVRQQLAAHDSVLVVTAVLRSRGQSIEAMWRQLASQKDAVVEGSYTTAGPPREEKVTIDVSLPEDTWVGRCAKRLSDVAGHLVTLVLFWIGIAVWLAFGPSQEWSNEWQLYMNSSSSALMLFVFAFLCCVRERHGDHVAACLDKIRETDEELERVLRRLTGDSRPHSTVVVPAPRITRLQRAINYYAEFIGSLVGVASLLVVVVAWAAAGPAFKFDATWWLLIGTYAGLVGMNDGFVMRHMSAQFQAREGAELARLAETDLACQALVPSTATLDSSSSVDPPKRSTLSRLLATIDRLTLRASLRVGWLCSHEYAVLLGVLVIAGLVVAASALKWSLTGQLLCNVPPSIIESFMMLMVIQGHNENDAKTRSDLSAVFERRAVLLAWARHVERYGVGTSVGFHPVLVGKYEPVVEAREKADKLDI